MKCFNCGNEMLLAHNAGFIRQGEMSPDMDAGTIRVSKLATKPALFGKEKEVMEVHYVTPKIYVCKNCGVVAHRIKESEAKLFG